MFEEKIYEPDELDPTEIAAAIDAEVARMHVAQRSWPAVTDCDRLDDAFLALSGRGVITLCNAGNTQSDGYEDFRDALQNSPEPDAVLGSCFYHFQDRMGRHLRQPHFHPSPGLAASHRDVVSHLTGLAKPFRKQKPG